MAELPGEGQFSIKTQGIGTVVSKAQRQAAFEKMLEKYKHEGFEVTEEPGGEEPVAVVVKHRSLWGDVKYKIHVNEYGSVLVEEPEASKA